MKAKNAEIPESEINEAKKILTKIFEGIFWLIYRDDASIDDLKSEIIECKLIDEESYSVIFDSIHNDVDAFRKIAQMTNEESDCFVRNAMTRLVDAITIAFPEMVYNQFEIAYTDPWFAL